MLIAAALAVASLTLTDRATVTLPTRDVRLGDVAIVDRRIASIVIARLPRARREIALTRRAMAALIRRAVPGMVVAGAEQPGAITLRVTAIAPRPVAAGVDRGAVRLSDPPAVVAGDELTLISRAGPVTVERAVTALQPGRNGRRLFVRDGAGHVSSIPFVGESAP